MRSDELRHRLVSDGPHALCADEVLSALDARATGLVSSEAAARLTRFGRNELPHAKAPGIVRVFFRQFLNPLIYILLAAAAVSGVMRDWSDAGFILAVLVLNAMIGSVQEYSAEKSAEALRALAGSRAYALRDGEDRELDATELVPGDVVLLEAGSKVPADVRLISTGGIEVDESLLTGESTTVTKTPAAMLAPATPLGDRVNMAFAATLVTRGRAHGVIVATALETQIGRIASSLTTSDSAKPPLLVRMERFTRKVAIGVLVAVVALGGVSVVQGSSISDVFMLAVALAVSAIPEGLPVALTVALSIGARRMARRKVIARRLVAVEALGSCTFIASDKTGTLTMNELTARQVLLPDGVRCEITGQGVKPDGEVVAPAGARAPLARLGRASVLCNDGFLGRRDEAWVHHGDAVDVALLVMAAKAGVHRADAEAESPRVGEIPFEPEHRFAATLHRTGDVLDAAVKGAGERVLPMCSRMATGAGDVPVDAAMLEAQANKLAASGFRVLAIAAGPVDLGGKELGEFGAGALTGLVFLGFVGMIDPLRPEAKKSVEACQAAGIQVAMVTGDHPVTALAIARELGFAEAPEQVVTGPTLERVAAQGARAIDALVGNARVFARVEPSQKLQIVQSLIRLGHFVAVTGDGANDAPALRAAHIGVAMGDRGTDVAKESADLIVTDDNFASIVAGVEEGRIAYGNVRKVIFLLVSSGAAELLLFVLTTAAGLPLPLWPVQLLWLNLVTNGIQDVALAFEPGEGGELTRPPRAPREPIFDRLMVERTAVSALLIALVGFFAYRWMLDHGWPVHQAQNGVLLLLVLFENVQAGNSRSETASLFTLSPLRNRLLFVGTIVAQALHIAAMYTPGLREVLHLEAVSIRQWLGSLGLAGTLFLISEVHKLLIRRRLQATS
ncbi:MAG: HAD-IC family P-type ATPase [Deltaproteobacteria bacterium]|nr:HAD-IC family P-type ATPase [Deltaproteobacteria bacterium]